MRLGMIQSNYIPWRGYFDFIDSVDVFVLYDDIPYGGGQKWRNRNRIRGCSGQAWLTVPVHQHSQTLVQDTRIAYDRNWVKSHCSRLREYYRGAPFTNCFIQEFESIISRRYSLISDLNADLLRWVCQILGIATRIISASDLALPPASKAVRPAMIARALDATEYLTGPNTLPYLNIRAFLEAGVSVYVKSYDYFPYPQQQSPFFDRLSVLDLLFNTGPDARTHLKSRTPFTNPNK
jgi:hypothetical protein